MDYHMDSMQHIDRIIKARRKWRYGFREIGNRLTIIHDLGIFQTPHITIYYDRRGELFKWNITMGIFYWSLELYF